MSRHVHRPPDSALAFLVEILCYLNGGWALTIVKYKEEYGGHYGIAVVNEFDRARK